MVIKTLSHKKFDPRIAALKPEKLSSNRLGISRPCSSHSQRPGQKFLKPGREIIDLEEEPDDVIDLGAPVVARRQSQRALPLTPPQHTRHRVCSTYVPNPRLYPGPQSKPKSKSKPKSRAKSARVEGRGDGSGPGRRRKRTFRRPVPNSRLYRPAPPRPPPPPLQPRAGWPPPPPPRPLATASRVAIELNERRRPRSARSPQRPSPPPAPSERGGSPRRLVVTLPAAGDSPAPPYRPASAHFRSRAPHSGASTPPAARLPPRPPHSPPPAMDAASRHSTPEDRSEGNETLSAPSEYLAEFLSAIMRRQYAEALKYCRLILQYEPQNSTARSFYPLLRHKVHAHRRAEKAKGEAPQECSSSEESEGEAWGDGAAAGSSGSSRGVQHSSEEEGEGEGEEEEVSAAGSVASQSSLELDSSDVVHSSPSISLSRRTDRTDSASGGCWESSGSASRSEADDNGNATQTTTKPVQPGDLENDNACGEPGSQMKSDSITSLRRLRAQFACSIK